MPQRYTFFEYVAQKKNRKFEKFAELKYYRYLCHIIREKYDQKLYL